MTPSPERKPEATDADLIERWTAGDTRAATQLVGRHSQALARFAARSGERDGIEELVQDTFVRAFASLDSFRGESSLRTWLFTIARRLLLDRRRAEKRRGERGEVQEADVATEYDSLDTVVADETQLRLKAAMAKLSPTQREVFTLRVSEGMSDKEIADSVGTQE